MPLTPFIFDAAISKVGFGWAPTKFIPTLKMSWLRIRAFTLLRMKWIDPTLNLFLRQHQVYFLSDFQHLIPGLNTNYHGLVEQLVVARGRRFAGCFFFTFSNFVNRLRGATIQHVINCRDMQKAPCRLATTTLLFERRMRCTATSAFRGHSTGVSFQLHGKILIWTWKAMFLQL